MRLPEVSDSESQAVERQELSDRPPSWYIIVKKTLDVPCPGGRRSTLDRGEHRRRRGRLRPVAFAMCSWQLVAVSRQPSLRFVFHKIITIIIILNTYCTTSKKITWQRRVWRSPPPLSSCTARSSPGSRRD